MKIEEIKKKSEQVQKLEWLESIANSYEKLIQRIDREKDFFRVTGISFQCRNDGEQFNLNPHKPIPYKYIRDGLAASLDGIRAEIESLKIDIEK